MLLAVTPTKNKVLALLIVQPNIWRDHEPFLSTFHSQNYISKMHVNLSATDFFFQILAHPVFKMWVIQKPNKVALWSKRHSEEKKMEIIQHV